MSDPLVNVLGPLEGAEIPGGCDQCDAYQKLRAESAGVWAVDVFHEYACPVLKTIEKGGK